LLKVEVVLWTAIVFFGGGTATPLYKAVRSFTRQPIDISIGLGGQASIWRSSSINCFNLKHIRMAEDGFSGQIRGFI
jgi:hypothetical protein